MTTKRTLKTAVAALAENLQKSENLKNSIQEQLTALKEQRERIEKFVLESTEDRLESVPEIVANLAPFVAFSATPKTIGSCIQAAMTIKQDVIPNLENVIKSEVGALKEHYDRLEGFALQTLEAAGTSSMKSDLGRVESRTQTKYNVADKSLFIKTMVDLGAESELTVTVRPNSKALGKIIDDTGEVPAGLTLYRNKVAVFVKS